MIHYKKTVCSFTNTGAGTCVVDPLANSCAIIDVFNNLDCRDPLNLNTDTITIS